MGPSIKSVNFIQNPSFLLHKVELFETHVEETQIAHVTHDRLQLGYWASLLSHDTCPNYALETTQPNKALFGSTF